MKTTPLIAPYRGARRGMGPAGALRAAMLIACLSSGTSQAEPLKYSTQGDKVIVESGCAARVTEQVRTAAPGTLVAAFVKVGDTVGKGQVLGHTELDATKYQFDLAKHALESMGPLKAAEGQVEAAAATRAETEEALRKRRIEKTRLDWAIAMERFHRSNYEARLEQKKLERIHFEYWKQQYDARFLRAPVDGVVTEVRAELGTKLGYAAHVFTVSDEGSYMVPVSVPEELAGGVTKSSRLPVRSTQGGHVARGVVNQISDDPVSPGKKLIRLLLHERDFPPHWASNLAGMTFDVLLPQTGRDMNS